MSPVDLTNLESLAKLATPGPWVAVNYLDYDCVNDHWYLDTARDRADYSQTEYPEMITENHWDADRADNDFKYIAAVNPNEILKLIEYIRELESKCQDINQSS
jgi:hypothetical protein